MKRSQAADASAICTTSSKPSNGKCPTPASRPSGSYPFHRSPRFSTTQFVTSNLDLKIQKADHHQGGGDARRKREPGANPFVINILTLTHCRSRFCGEFLANGNNILAESLGKCKDAPSGGVS